MIDRSTVAGGHQGNGQEKSQGRRIRAQEPATRRQAAASGATRKRHQPAGDHGDREQLLPRHRALPGMRSWKPRTATTSSLSSARY